MVRIISRILAARRRIHCGEGKEGEAHLVVANKTIFSLV
jgi:hypothetical protein